MSGSAWFDRTGEALGYQAVVRRAASAQVVLLGEHHDRADHHRWQLHVAAALAAQRPVTLGFEMFSARANPVLADWVAGELTEEEFLTDVGWRETWGFPAELYLPIFRFCREMRIPMIGLNVRRDLVRAVRASGWEAVPDDLKEGLTRPAPSPAAYRRFIFDLTGGRRAGREAQSPDDPAFDGFVAAQETWDRAFASRLSEIVTTSRLAIGIMGMGHIQFGGGVPWQLRDLGVKHCFTAIPVDADQLCVFSAADATMILPQPVTR